MKAAARGLTSVAPEKMLDILRDYHELVNTPRVGVADNLFWHSQQLNIAPAKHGDSGEWASPETFPTWDGGKRRLTEDSLKEDMGVSGDAHEDIHYSEMSFSNMLVLSDIPDLGKT